MPRELGLPFMTRDMLDFSTSSTFKLSIWVSSNNTSIINVNILTKSGSEINRIALSGNPSAPDFFTIPLSEIPIFLSIDDTGSGVEHSTVYVRVMLMINGVETIHLCQGYIGGDKAVSWPHQLALGSVPDEYELRAQTVSDPAANTEISVTVGSGQIWEPVFMSFTLTADANAANRLVHVRYQQGTTILAEMVAPAVQTANQTVKYILAPNLENAVVTSGSLMTMRMPAGILLDRDQKIVTVTDNKQVTDDYSVPLLSTKTRLTFYL